MARKMKIALTVGYLSFVVVATALLFFPGSPITIAANNPYGIVKGVNGQWPIIQCGNGSTPQSCTEHWVIGSGSQDPTSGFGSDGDLFWRSDLRTFHAKAGGAWTGTPTSAACTGIGSTGTTVLEAGSTDSAGTFRLTAGGR